MRAHACVHTHWSKYSQRELSVAVNRKKNEAEAAVNLEYRASVAAAEAGSVSELLGNRDVMTLFCGEGQAELNRLQKLLREEKQEHEKTKRAHDQLTAKVERLTCENDNLNHKLIKLQTDIDKIERVHAQVCLSR